MLLCLKCFHTRNFMLQYLDKLRSKPRHVRQRISIVLTATLSLLIVTIWWSTWDIYHAPDGSAVSADAVSPLDVVANIYDDAKALGGEAWSEAQAQLEYDANTATIAGVAEWDEDSSRLNINTIETATVTDNSSEEIVFPSYDDL